LLDMVVLPNIEKIELLIGSSSSAAQAIDRLVGFAPKMIRDTQWPKFIKVLIADAGAFPEHIALYREKVIDRALAAIAGLLEQGHKRGELEVEDAALTAKLVVAPMLFSAIWAVVFDAGRAEKLDLDALFSLHGAMLYRALGITKELDV
ncbi:MAG: TetR/AcrR family transcriptional regulator C-terminal domain-containing protein, partial [Pseudomonadales bacterium]